MVLTPWSLAYCATTCWCPNIFEKYVPRSPLMSFSIQSPQRPLPGAYVQTPAASKFQSGPISQPSFQSRPATTPQQYGSQPQSQALTEQSSTNLPQVAIPPVDNLSPIKRAAKAINVTLSVDKMYPELDSYIGRKL